MKKITELFKLNAEQAEIVRSSGARIAVSAGAGTGKTRLLAACCLAELESENSDISSVAAITFTDNAAAELRQRIGNSIGDYIKKFGERGGIKTDAFAKLSTAHISTIHGLAARIVRENLSDTNSPAGFEIAELGEAENLLNKAVLETVLNFGNKENSPESLDALLESESFNLEGILKNISSIIRRSSEKHLRFPLKTPEIKTGFSVKKFAEFLSENKKLFSSKHSRKRFEKILEKIELCKVVPDPAACVNFKDIEKHAAQIQKLKNADDAEKNCAAEIQNLAKVSADLLNSRLTKQYLPVAEEAAKRYREIKIQNSLADYEDLLANALEALEKNPEALSHYQKKFSLIMVDEFQDTDSLQNKIIKTLCGIGKTRLIIVGDRMQSIYGFRGAEPELFDKALKCAQSQKFNLTTNYRTSQNLMNFINNFFTNIIDDYTPMKPVKKCRGTFVTFQAEGENLEETRENEAEFIAKKISEITANGEYSLGEIALIFRRSGNMAIYEKALQCAGLPFKRVGETNFLKLSEIRDIVSMMKFIFNPLDEKSEAAILRSPFFGISDTGLMNYFSEKRENQTGSYFNFLKALAKKEDEKSASAARYLLSIIEEKERINISSPFDAARFAAFFLGYVSGAPALGNGLQIRANIIKFLEICEKLSEKGVGLSECLKTFDEKKNIRNKFAPENEAENSVTLITCHSSKGLEFPVVFLADTNYSQSRSEKKIAINSKTGVMVCHDGCGFGKWKEITEEDIEEEKRILYVAMTRAKDIVFTQRHSKPRRLSFAELIEKGLGKMSVTAESCDEPNLIKKIKSSRETKFAKKSLEKLTAKNIRPVFEEIPQNGKLTEFSRVSRTEEGEIFHRFFELWDFSPESVEKLAEFAAAEKFISGNFITEKIAACAKKFLKSPLAKMIDEANSIRRECEFTIETNCEKTKEIRNGKIDLIIENKGEIVLVDYKYTDFFLPEKYTQQIEFYSKAVEKLYGKVPAKRHICLLPEVELKDV